MCESPDNPGDTPEEQPTKPTCNGTTKAGNPCQSTVLLDGEYCAFHAPKGLDPSEIGRMGGRKPAHARRAHEKSGNGQRRDGRERLRAEFEADSEMYAKLRAAYEGGIEAVTTCPNCKERALPDYRVRIAAGDSFLAQIYGKPQQSIQAKHEHRLIVVHRLSAALEAADVVDVPGSDVTELEAGDSSD